MQKRTNNSEVIKKKYLRKLSIELIKRGVSNKQIKSVLDEMEITLKEYISEKKLGSLDELEKAFGSVKDFCENNILEYSKEGSFGQMAHLSLIGISFIAIITLISASFFLSPYNWIIRGSSAILMGVSAANVGSGFIGTLFGLNMFTWIIYQHIRKRFSKYDIREIVKKVILGLYWFIFLVWFVQVILPYTVFPQIIGDMWKQGMKFLIIEGILRWVFLGVFLLFTAILYTMKYKKTNQNFINKEYLIDNLKIVFIFFILTSFIIPNPGIGVMVVFLGLCILLFGETTGETWFIGILAISLQAIALSTKMDYNVPYPISGFASPIVFGIKLSFDHQFVEKIQLCITITIVLAVIWTIICVIILKKRKKRLFPVFQIPNKKKILQSILLLSIIGLATLGSQPKHTMVATGHDHHFIPPEPNHEFLIYEATYMIPAKGKIYFSIFTDVNVTFDEIDYWSLEGNWTVQWEYGPLHGGTFGDFSEFEYRISNGVIALDYLEFEANGTGILEIYFECDLKTFGGILPSFSVVWAPIIPWFPTWVEIVIIGVNFLLIFFTWEKPTNRKSTSNNKEEPKEET